MKGSGRDGEAPKREPQGAPSLGILGGVLGSGRKGADSGATAKEIPP